MKKFLITTLILFVLVVGGSLLASCTAESFTTTITVQPPGSTSTVITPVFEHTPPDIPHVYVIEDAGSPQIGGLISEDGEAICFVCHGIPVLHSDWLQDVDLCLECHRISANPILNPL